MTTTSFAALSWNDLEEWAGPAILGRGKSYRRRVHDLALNLIANAVALIGGRANTLSR